MYTDFIGYVGKLISDLFTIWSYKSFGLLLTMCGIYMCVKLVRGMVNML